MNTEFKDADIGMEDSGVGSSCSSSVSDAQLEPLDNILDGDDSQSAGLDSEDDETLPFMQVSIPFYIIPTYSYIYNILL